MIAPPKSFALPALSVVGVLMLYAVYSIAPSRATSPGGPIMIFCARTIIPGLEEKYKKDFTAFASYVMDKDAGVKATFSFMDKDKAGQALQVFIFDDEAAFLAQPQDKPELSSELWSDYDPAAADYDTCQVFGGWTEFMKTIAGTLPLTYVFQPPLAGYIKSTTDLEGTPIFFINKRAVVPGMVETYGKNFQAVADVWSAKVPGCLAAYDFVSAEDPNAVWDLRILANFGDGFIGHVSEPSVGPLLPGVLGLYSSQDFTGMPSAIAISAPGEPEAMVAANPGNAAYTHYTWDEVLGPMPAF